VATREHGLFNIDLALYSDDLHPERLYMYFKLSMEINLFETGGSSSTFSSFLYVLLNYVLNNVFAVALKVNLLFGTRLTALLIPFDLGRF